MHRKQPVINKYLSKKWDDKLMALHNKRIENARPVMDKTSPKYYSHLQSQPKKHQMIEGKNKSLKITRCYRTIHRDRKRKQNVTWENDNHHELTRTSLPSSAQETGGYLAAFGTPFSQSWVKTQRYASHYGREQQVVATFAKKIGQLLHQVVGDRRC